MQKEILTYDTRNHGFFKYHCCVQMVPTISQRPGTTKAYMHGYTCQRLVPIYHLHFLVFDFMNKGITYHCIVPIYHLHFGILFCEQRHNISMKQTSDSNNDIGTYSLAKNHNHINYMFMFIHRKLLHKKKN